MFDRSVSLNDIRRDWWRWSKGERMSAISVGAVFVGLAGNILDCRGVFMKIVCLLVFIGCMAVVALTGCDAREEHGLPLTWSNG